MSEINSFDVEVDGVCCYALESAYKKLSEVQSLVKACDELLGHTSFPYHTAKQLTKVCLELEELLSRMQPIFDPHNGKHFVGDVDNPYYAHYKTYKGSVVAFPGRPREK